MTIKIQLINGKKFQNLHNPIINSVKETKDNSLALIVTVQQIAGTAGGLTAPDNSPTAENGDSLSPTFYSSPNGPDPRHVVPAQLVIANEFTFHPKPIIQITTDIPKSTWA